MVTEITLTIKGIIQAVMKEAQRAYHAVIEIGMTCTANEDSPDIYTLGDQQRRKKWKKKKKNTDTILLKPLFYCNLRLP